MRLQQLACQASICKESVWLVSLLSEMLQQQLSCKQGQASQMWGIEHAYCTARGRSAGMGAPSINGSAWAGSSLTIWQMARAQPVCRRRAQALQLPTVAGQEQEAGTGEAARQLAGWPHGGATCFQPAHQLWRRWPGCSPATLTSLSGGILCEPVLMPQLKGG